MLEQATLKSQIRVVVKARGKATELKAQRDTSLEAWNRANRELLDALTQAGAEVAGVEDTLRELTLQAYAETGNKAPVVGVGIREVTKLDYDKEIAFKWATEHVMALKLDTTAFEKIVKASPLDFVRIYQEPLATIATQLEVVD